MEEDQSSLPSWTSQTAGAEQYSSLRGKRVVVCEDEGVTQMQLGRIFARAGMIKVGEASSGEEAVAVILRERPDIVLMDIGLDGMDGWQASRAIFATYTPCILMLTGQPPETYAQIAAEIPVRGYLAKPVQGPEILATIAAACGTGVTVEDGVSDTHP
jgi:CheY-like chemotaxis protein